MTAADVKHEEPQGFIFSPCPLSSGSNIGMLRNSLFLSERFHIWTLVLICARASFLSTAESACIKAADVAVLSMSLLI